MRQLSRLHASLFAAVALTGALAACGDDARPRPVPVEPTAQPEPDIDPAFVLARPGGKRNVLLGSLWRAVGPAGILDGQAEHVTPRDKVSGGVHAVVPHPTDPDRMWIGTTNGGVWETRNARAEDPHWTPLTDQLPSLSISALDLDPTDPGAQTLAAGLGLVSSYYTSGAFDGVILSRDGGRSWQRLADPLLTGRTISGVAVRGQVLVAAGTSNRGYVGPGGVFRSVDGGRTWAQLDALPTADVYDLVGDPARPARLFAVATGGVWMTDDTGATWTELTRGDARLGRLLADEDGSVGNVELDVGPTGRLWIVVTRYGLMAYAGYLDVNAEAPAAWVAMDLPYTPEGATADVTGAEASEWGVRITAPGHGLTDGDQVEVRGVDGADGVHLVISDDDDHFHLYEATLAATYAGGGSYRRVDGSHPRARGNTGPFPRSSRPGGQGDIHLSIVADPTNPDLVYLGGDRQGLGATPEGTLNHLGAENYSGRLFRGDARIAATGAVPSPQWQHLTHRDDVPDMPGGGTASSSAPHADSRDMAFDAAGTLIEVDDGGIFRRSSPRDATGDWTSMVGDLGNTELHNVAYDSVSKATIGGAQDVGTPMYVPSERAWVDYTQGDGGDVLVDDVTLAAEGRSIRYSTYPGRAITYRSIWGADGELIDESQVALAPTDEIRVRGRFTTPVELNAIEPRRLAMCGDNGVFESLDQGDTTRQVQAIERDPDTRRSPACTLAYGGRELLTGKPDVLYFSVGKVVHLRATAERPAAPTPGAFPGETVRDLAIGPSSWRTAYAIDARHVYVTTDAGGSWTDITGDLDDASLRSVLVVPILPFFDYLLVGGATGVSMTFVAFGRPIGAPVWFELGSNLPNALVYDLDWDPTDRLLTVATMGRGAWQARLPTAPRRP